MKLKHPLNQTRTNRVLAFGLPFLAYVIVMIIAGYTPFGSSSILYSDMWHQYYPFFVEFRDTLRSGDSLLYNWDMGLGLDYLGLISYYLASPLNLLSVLLPESWLLGYFSLLVPIKLGLAGLFFGLFLEKVFQQTGKALPIFAAAYGLCTWALGYQWNIMWLDTFALLPLVMLGMVSLLKKRKFFLYTFSLFLAIVCNYYIGLFVCIFVGLSFFVYEICYCKSFKGFWIDLGLMAVFSTLAIAMTAFLEWPTLKALGDTQSSVNKFPTGFDLNITTSDTWKGLLDAMRQVAGNTLGGQEVTFKEGLPNLYCGVFPLVLLFQYFASRKFKLREKLCTGFLLIFFMLSFILRQLDYIWHGFHFTNMIPYRFSFLFSFVVLVCAYRAFLVLEEEPKWKTILSGVLVLGLMACSDNRLDPLFLGYNLIFLGFSLYFILSRAREKKALVPEAPTADQALSSDGDVFSPEEAALVSDSGLFIESPSPRLVEVTIPLTPRQQRQNRQIPVLLLSLMVLELACGTANFGARFGGTNVSNYPKGRGDTAAVLEYMQELDNPIYYRAEATHTQTLNDDALNGYSGITLFSSSANVRVTKFMQALGFGAKPSYNRYSYEEASPVADLFLNLKYRISREGTYVESETYQHLYNMGRTDLLENLAYLPLGFMTQEAIMDISSEYESAGTFQFQNYLFTAATGIQEDVLTSHQEFTVEASEGITTRDRGSSGSYSYSTGTSTGTVTVSMVVPRDGFVLLDLYVSKRNSITVYKNDTQLYTESLNLDQMLSAGNCKAGDKIDVVFDCKKTGEDGRITLKAAMLESQVFWDGYRLLSQNTMEVTSLDGTTLSGTVTATEDAPILYTSIPYNDNWVAEVDGEPQEVFPVCDTMVGLRLSPGTHTVTFRYDNTAFYQGLTISGGAGFLFFGLVLLAYYPRKKGKYQHAQKRSGQ